MGAEFVVPNMFGFGEESVCVANSMGAK